MAQSAGAVEYINWISDSPKACPRYDTELSDGEDLVIMEPWEKRNTPFIAIATRSTLAQSGSTWYGPINGSYRTKLSAYSKLNH